jgi:hypothetical protein
MKHEVWKAVVGEPNCEVSSFGRVRYQARVIRYKDGRSYEKAASLLSSKSKQGYPAVSLTLRRYVCVHTLVAEAFLGKKPAWARTVNHLDGDKTNNRSENLEWASYADNNRHARRTQLNRQRGENCNLTSFSDDVVDAIRILWPVGRFTQKELGVLFGMSENHVHEIVANKSRRLPTR